VELSGNDLKNMAIDLHMSLYRDLIPLFLHAVELKKRNPQMADEIRPLQEAGTLDISLYGACHTIYKNSFILLRWAEQDDEVKAARRADMLLEDEHKQDDLTIKGNRFLVNVERALTALKSPMPIAVLKNGQRLPGDV
jgi:hypothetical protein